MHKHRIGYTLGAALALTTAIQITACKSNSGGSGMFENMNPKTTGIKFENKLLSKPLFNILYYLYYYNGGGVATGDINNDGLPDVYFTANSKSGNKLYLNTGNFQFRDITDSAGVAGQSDWCTGVTMADINGDGLLDIYTGAITNKYGLTGRNELFINTGNGKFKESAAQYGLDFAGLNTQSIFFDYDHDGDLDCFMLNQSHHPHANIVDTANRRKYDPMSGDRLYRNDVSTTGKFTDVSAEAGIYQSGLGYGLGIAVADINNDGWEDIYVGNDFHENDYYYINTGNGKFVESGATHFQHYSRFSMGNDVADYNNDGQLDIVTVDMLPPDETTLKTYGSDENPDIYKVKLELHGYQNQTSRNCLQRNNGNGVSFSETGLISGISATDWSWAPLLADFDNDGNKDLVITSGIVKRPVDLDYVRFISDLDRKHNRQQTDAYDDDAIKSMPDGSAHPFFFKGDGKTGFTEATKDWGTSRMKGYFNGAAYADFDNDGDLDLVMNCINAPATVLRNNTTHHRSIAVTLKGNDSNTFGLGAKVWLFGKGGMQYQQLMLTRGFQSSSEPRLHFGLGDWQLIDSLLVVWPNQKFQFIRRIPPIPKITLNQAEASGVFDYKTHFPTAAEPFTDITAQTGLGWKHTENDFLDYNQQYLIPHQLSTRGPKLAVADVNKDGLDDLYACGAAGQPGALFIQTAGGRFIMSDSAVFRAAAASEEVDALFTDVNNDGWPDLLTVSGGNQLLNGDPALGDHVYLNDGKGHFTAVASGLPPLLRNKGSISAADIDKDGDTDLFIGGLADAKQYGINQPSYLLLNDGKGNFTAADSTRAALGNLGMVTASAFTDLDKDGWPDLVVTGEWMPLTIWMNKQGRFTRTDIPASTGLWQSLHIADVNGDGNMDILAGNWGHNTKLWAGKNGPVKLFIKDFDKNGSVEQVMTCSIDGKDYPFLAKDELERPLPVLKKAYLTYKEVAGKTVDYLLYDLFKDYSTQQAETLGSACFISNGKGGFTKQDLPVGLQLSPVFSFINLPQGMNGQYMALGNFYGVIPYEGRYDGLFPTMFSWKDSSFTEGPRLNTLRGEVRDAKWVKTKDGQILVVAKNNEGLTILKRN